VDDVRSGHQVLVEEVGGVGAVSDDAADLGRAEEDLVDLFLLEEGAYRALIQEIELLAGAKHEIRVAFVLELAHDRGTHQSTVPGDEYPGVHRKGLERLLHQWLIGSIG
jgi:hypothetical protein